MTRTVHTDTPHSHHPLTLHALCHVYLLQVGQFLLHFSPGSHSFLSLPARLQETHTHIIKTAA